MNDKFYWRSILSIALILLMWVVAIKAIYSIDKDRTVWMSKDIKWQSCSCSTQVKEYFDLCKEWLSECEIDVEDSAQNKQG